MGTGGPLGTSFVRAYHGRRPEAAMTAFAPAPERKSIADFLAWEERQGLRY